MPYIIVAVVTWVLAGVFFQTTLGMEPAAYHMPRILCVLVSILAGLMLVDVFLFRRRRRKGAVAEDPSAPLLSRFFDGVNIVRAGAFLGSIVLYIVLLEPVGYFIMTPLFLIGMFLLLRACRLWMAASIGIVAPIFVYLIFVIFLDLPIPMGVMG